MCMPGKSLSEHTNTVKQKLEKKALETRAKENEKEKVRQPTNQNHRLACRMTKCMLEYKARLSIQTKTN